MSRASAHALSDQASPEFKAFCEGLREREDKNPATRKSLISTPSLIPPDLPISEARRALNGSPCAAYCQLWRQRAINAPIGMAGSAVGTW